MAATAAAPGLRLMLRRRVARGKEEAARLSERFGVAGAARPPGRVLWLHAASVGESLSALPLLSALPEAATILLTTGTRTSAGLLAARLPELGLQDRVLHQYVPLDVPAWASRFLDAWRPDAACFLESELWPNLLAACRTQKIPLALVNARLSARSAASWARVPGFARRVLGGFAFVAARSEQDAERLRALGAAQVVVWGDLKLAAAPLPFDQGELERLRESLAGAPCWLAASTHPADEAIAAAVHRRLAARHPGLVTAIVPRHPERGAALAEQLGAPRRSLGAPPPAGGGLWVADTLGELGLFYRAFSIVLIGKGFADGGGQNAWEPAQLGCAIATGPATHNFVAVVSLLRDAGGLCVVADEDALTRWVETMLADTVARAAMGLAARTATQAASDVATRLAARLAMLLGLG